MRKWLWLITLAVCGTVIATGFITAVNGMSLDAADVRYWSGILAFAAFFGGALFIFWGQEEPQVTYLAPTLPFLFCFGAIQVGVESTPPLWAVAGILLFGAFVAGIVVYLQMDDDDDMRVLSDKKRFIFLVVGCWFAFIGNTAVPLALGREHGFDLTDIGVAFLMIAILWAYSFATRFSWLAQAPSKGTMIEDVTKFMGMDTTAQE